LSNPTINSTAGYSVDALTNEGDTGFAAAGSDLKEAGDAAQFSGADSYADSENVAGAI